MDPVEHVRPALQGDALEDRQHGLADIVEVCNPILGPIPILPADGSIRTFVEPSTWRRLNWHLI